MKKKTPLVELVADAVQELNATPEACATIRVSKGRYLHFFAASECDLPYWLESIKECRGCYEPEQFEELSPFQRKHGGAGGLYFCESDKDGEELDDSEGGQFDGYLSNWSAAMPRKLALKCAADLLDAVGINVS